MDIYSLTEDQIKAVVSCALEGLERELPQHQDAYFYWTDYFNAYFFGKDEHTRASNDIFYFVRYTVASILTVEELNSIDAAIDHYEKCVPNYGKMKDKVLFYDAVLSLAYFLNKKKKNEQTPSAPASSKVDENKKDVIAKLLEFGSITKSPFKDNERRLFFFPTERFTPELIKHALCVTRIPWKVIASFQRIVPLPYEYERKDGYNPVPMTTEQLRDCAYNNNRKKH